MSHWVSIGKDPKTGDWDIKDVPDPLPPPPIERSSIETARGIGLLILAFLFGIWFSWQFEWLFDPFGELVFLPNLEQGPPCDELARPTLVCPYPN